MKTGGMLFQNTGILAFCCSELCGKLRNSREPQFFPYSFDHLGIREPLHRNYRVQILLFLFVIRFLVGLSLPFLAGGIVICVGEQSGQVVLGKGDQEGGGNTGGHQVEQGGLE